MGFEGNYIRISQSSYNNETAAPHEMSFVIRPDPPGYPCPDPLLIQLVYRILPSCSAATYLRRYCASRSRYEFGRVSHAFAAAISTILDSCVYTDVVSNLDRRLQEGSLSAQELWAEARDDARKLEILKSIAEEVEELSGGHLLGVLIASSGGGDSHMTEILDYLTSRASLPYYEMLTTWIHGGEIDDPHQEFMVFVERDVTKDLVGQRYDADYWGGRYRLQEDNRVPFFLKEYAQTILSVGKYLNVMRECGMSHTFDPIVDHVRPALSYGMGHVKLRDAIDSAFQFAASKLLDLLIRNEQLIDHLQIIKRYFLLDQGDFFVQFLDLAGNELEQNVSQLSEGRIQSLLSISIQAIHASSSSHLLSLDRHWDYILCDLIPYSLIEHLDAVHSFSGGISAALPVTPSRSLYGQQEGLKGIEAFALDYHVEWPLSLILSKKSIIKYQLIFRHLFYAKYVERRLFSTWLDHQSFKELDLRSVLGATYCLRQRMLHFMQNFVYYMMFEVNEPLWHKLMEKLAEVKTVDELMKCHDNFQDRVLNECLLSNRELLNSLTKLMSTCLTFSEQMERFAKATKLEEEYIQYATEERAKRSNYGRAQKKLNQRLMIDKELRDQRVRDHTARMKKEVLSDPYRRMINKFVEVFDSNLSKFMTQLLEDSRIQNHSHLTNLCTRLDYNGFVTRSMNERKYNF
eukprot:CAMPEP_0113331358 /NCGR_PEP_ID=MMETSP0010_2-20120614/22420_1 /TAXON_ID=216773 ORGANISM="Corethron hystrix, Strain 308" /NCGR_SAMPLE_ID=MMETSP0010_2 /ASSEMBLY_ACC=CAM_ASM_000155 /LENGTH=687 /DNA_ID=CAMNT_0000194567 /DNA_START=244 /DNA_END=2307 /DNA_ORIENTATION=- /assembly_acc=CAM_ASM_000155